jgi:hypothetical protein
MLARLKQRANTMALRYFISTSLVLSCLTCNSNQSPDVWTTVFSEKEGQLATLGCSKRFFIGIGCLFAKPDSPMPKEYNPAKVLGVTTITQKADF